MSRFLVLDALNAEAVDTLLEPAEKKGAIDETENLADNCWT
jgi:hypothetical protein